MAVTLFVSAVEAGGIGGESRGKEIGAIKYFDAVDSIQVGIELARKAEGQPVTGVPDAAKYLIMAIACVEMGCQRELAQVADTIGALRPLLGIRQGGQ